MLDREVTRKLQKFLEEIEMGIFSANREVIRKAVPELTRESFMAFAVRVAEARARYIKAALELSAKANPTPAELAGLKAAREAHEEKLGRQSLREREGRCVEICSVDVT